MRLWLRALLLRGRLDAEMREEMRAHMERSAERLESRGLRRAEAERAAAREFGNLDYFQEQGRDARGGRWVESVFADVRFGLRHFGRTPLSTVTMVLVLGLGLGVNTALFTVMHSLLTLPPRGISRDPSLVRVRGLERRLEAGSTTNRWLSYPEVRDYTARTGLFSEVAAFHRADVVLRLGSGSALVQAGQAIFVTGNYFRVLGVTLSAGAGLPPALAVDDPAPPMVAVISHAMWLREFDGSSAALGRTIDVNGVAVTIAGVAPANFRGTNDGIPKQVWLPMAALAAIENRSVRAFASYDSTFLRVVARLQPGVTIADAQPVVESIALRTKQRVARADERILPHADIVPVRFNNDDRDRGNGPVVLATLFSGITLLILLITCANVSAILVGLVAARRREIAVRLSLGAARARLIRQLITECVLLAIAAGGLGAFVVWSLIQVFRSRFEDAQIVLNWPALAFTAGFAIVAGILFGLSPALHATRLAISGVLKDSAGTVAGARSRLQRALVVGQIALTQPLLVGLGALILLLLAMVNDRQSMLNEQILAIEFNASAGNASGPQIRQTKRRLQERISTLPGVAKVVQNSDSWRHDDFVVHPSDRVPGIEYRNFRIKAMLVAGGYFDLLDIPFVRGRDFVAVELESVTPAVATEEVPKTMRPAVIIGSDLARQFWGAANPIGRRLSKVGGHAEELVVVGVVDARIAGESYDGSSTRVYVPGESTHGGLYVRTQRAAAAMIPFIRSVVTTEAPDLPIVMMRTLAASEEMQRTNLLRASAAAAGAGLLVLLLSAIGLYAVVAFAVGQRIREIGVRTALGADRRQVVGPFFFQGIRLSFIGLGMGLPLSLIAVRMIMRILDAPAVSGAWVALLIVAGVVSVAGVASWIPARRAAGVDPLTALRLD